MIAGLASKKMPIEIVLISATAVVLVGVGLLSSLPTSSHFWAGTYGYEIIAGLGLGLASPPYFVLISTSIPEKDVAAGTGALNMMRTLGGAIAVAICTAVHRGHLNDNLPKVLTPEQASAVRDSSSLIAQLPENTKNQIGAIFGGSYNRQFQVMLAFAALNFIVSIILAIVRKKVGLYGAVPVRREENEFTQAAERKSPRDKLPSTDIENRVAKKPTQDEGVAEVDSIAESSEKKHG